MKQLLTILSILLTTTIFAQSKRVVVKVQGTPGVYNISKTGDSLIYYVAGTRYAVSMGSNNVDSLGGKPAGQYADTANYISKAVATATYAVIGSSYTKAESNTLLGTKADTGDVVKLTGTQSIGGEKTFTNMVMVSTGGQNTLIDGNGLWMYSSNSTIYAPLGVKITYWNGTAVTSSLQATNDGNIGINTSTPSERLDVVGNGKFSGNVTAANLYSKSEIDTKLASKLDTSYVDTTGLLSPLKFDSAHKRIYIDMDTLKALNTVLADSMGVGGAALAAGVTVYSKDKATHTIFGGDNGKSIVSTGNMEFVAPDNILFDAISVGVTPGNNWAFLTPDYVNQYATYMDGAANNLRTLYNSKDIYKLDTIGHFMPYSLDLSNTQYNTGGDSITADIDKTNMVVILNQSAALKIKNPIGHPSNGQQLLYQISDNGTARAITWESDFGFDATDAPMPTTTITTKYMYVDCIWNEDTGKYFVMSVKTRDR